MGQRQSQNTNNLQELTNITTNIDKNLNGPSGLQSLNNNIANLDSQIGVVKKCPDGWRYAGTVSTYMINTPISYTGITENDACITPAEKKYSMTQILTGDIQPTEFSCPIGKLIVNGNANELSTINTYCVISSADYKRKMCPYGITTTNINGVDVDKCNPFSGLVE